MSGITTGIGLISGLPTADLIDSLIAVAGRPRDFLNTRIANLQSERSAYLDLSARLLGLKAVTSRLAKPSFFQQFLAGSSDDSVLTATASENAAPGVLELTVRSLVASHQLVSRGFADADLAQVGVGQLTIEIGHGKLNPSTALGDLNGGDGVRRGKIEITDRDGNTAEVDISASVTVDDVLDAINAAASVNVHARAAGNRIILEDTVGGAGTLSVTDMTGGSAAADLGIAKSAAADTLTGDDVFYLSDSVALARLNDGNGVRTNGPGQDDFKITRSDGTSFTVSLAGMLNDNSRLDVLNHGNGVRLGEIRITNRAGQTAIVDLSGAQTIGDIRSAISGAVDTGGVSLGVTTDSVGLNGVGSLVLTDSTSSPEGLDNEFKIEDVTGNAAADLGIINATTEDSFVGSGIYSITTIGDVVRAINLADGNQSGTVVASLTANGIKLVDGTFGLGSLVVESIANAGGSLSKAASDLGIEGTFGSLDVTSRHLFAGMNTVLLHSLNGGSGVDGGQVSFTARDGTVTAIDLSAAQTVQDVIELINATTSSSGISASLNSVGNGIRIADVTGASSNNLKIEEVGGTTAADLGILGEIAGTQIAGSNLQLQYYSELTRLDELNGGRGVREGTIQFQNSDGNIFTIDVGANEQTFGQVIDLINTAGSAFNVTASINATGDGILIADASGGTGQLQVTDINGGLAATDLRIEGQAAAGETQLDGSFEIRIDVDAGDTLSDVVTKIANASPDLSAAVINDGASSEPFRLSLTSGITGTRGEVLFDFGTTNLDMSTLVAARDAVVLIGGANADNPIVVTGSTNNLTDVLPGVEINLAGVSDEAVTLSVSRDIEGIVSDLETFVANYNSVIDRIDSLTSYDQETEQRGVLLGDATVSTIENRLSRTVLTRFGDGRQGFETLRSVGISFGDGGRLSFDEETFREKWAADAQAVQQFFSDADTGAGSAFDAMLDDLTRTSDGLLARRDATLGQQVDALDDRIESMDLLLDRRREQLERQFANLETALAGMQGQQQAISMLSQMANL